MGRPKKVKPADTTTATNMLQKLAEWNAAKEATVAVGHLFETEMRLRKELFAVAFPTPVEGANTVDLANGWKLKGTYKLDRKIDETTLGSVLQQLREQGVIADALVRAKPELVTAAYKALTDDTRAVFEQCMTIKPASPTVELVPPKPPAE